MKLTPMHRAIADKLGKRISPATAWRWIRQGVKCGDGRVRLDAVRVGASWYVTDDALDRFIAAQTAAAIPPLDDDGPVERRSDATRRRLEAAGLL